MCILMCGNCVRLFVCVSFCVYVLVFIKIWVLFCAHWRVANACVCLWVNLTHNERLKTHKVRHTHRRTQTNTQNTHTQTHTKTYTQIPPHTETHRNKHTFLLLFPKRPRPLSVPGLQPFLQSVLPRAILDPSSPSPSPTPPPCCSSQLIQPIQFNRRALKTSESTSLQSHLIFPYSG